MRRIAPFGLVFLCLMGGLASAEQSETELHQPTRSRSNLVLEAALGEAKVDRDGSQPRRVAVRPNELLTTIDETRSGWTAAGIKEVRHGTKLILVSRSGGGTKRLAPPQPQRHDLRLRPTLLVSDEAMNGLAWLEGPDLTSLSVRTSARVHDEWDEISIVAPPARGSQTGLVATGLADGSWLLAWSAFDGKDDDILWSRGREGRWTPPRRIDQNNSVPDVMPTLVATDNGALLAWSRMIDGHYQILLSRFDGEKWLPPSLVGPPGSLEPRFAIHRDGLHLLYHHAWPAAWAVADLAPSGRIQRIAILVEDQPNRPVLVDSSNRSVELRWPHQGRRSLSWEAVP